MISQLLKIWMRNEAVDNKRSCLKATSKYTVIKRKLLTILE